MSTHTPGPWQAGQHGQHIVSAGEIPIAHCPYVGIDDEHHANARLIAAAPDLLKACQKLLAQEKQLRTRSLWLEFRAIETAVSKAECAKGKADESK